MMDGLSVPRAAWSRIEHPDLMPDPEPQIVEAQSVATPSLQHLLLLDVSDGAVSPVRMLPAGSRGSIVEREVVVAVDVVHCVGKGGEYSSDGRGMRSKGIARLKKEGWGHEYQK